MKLILSLHDVAPPFEPEIRRQVRLLREMGVDRLVLKVVPNWHGSYPLESCPSLSALLREEAALGSQIVLHGLEHRRAGPLRGHPVSRLRAALFAGDAAEFLTLSRDAAEGRIQAGLAILARCGLPVPSTFCAPGWLMTREAEGAAAAAGISRTISMFSVHDLRSGRHTGFAGFGYMGAGQWQERGVGLLNMLVTRAWLPRAPVARVFFHPPRAHARELDSVLNRVADLLERGWQPVTFDDL